MKILTCLDHKQSLAAYTAAGHGFPAIPEGMNTVWHHFTMTDGTPAIIINQRGMTPIAADNEEEVNGCSLLIAREVENEDYARSVLEKTIKEILEIK